MDTKIIENTLLTLINEFKKDEELKTNRLNEIFSKTKTIIKEVKEEMKQYPPQFCIFDVINLQRYENYNSDLIAKLLEVNIKYKEDTELSFVKDFLIYLNDKFKWDYYGFKSIEKLEKINHSDISIKREEYANSRRMDLFISYKKDFAIIIENKIYASDQPNQLYDYYNYIKNKNIYGKNIYIIYLTPYGNKPSEYSLSLHTREELGNNFQTLKHSDIALWLENILEKYNLLFEEKKDEIDNDNKYIKDYRLLKSAMIQTIHNANMLSNNTKELDMTKGKIQELLKEHLFQDIQTVEDAEEYKQIFNSVIDIINEKEICIKVKPHIEFTEKVLDYLKKNDELKSYKFLTEIKIINDIYQEGYSHNIKYSFCNGEVELILESSKDCFFLHIYLYNLNDNKKYNILRKKLNLEINKIFCKFYEDKNYVYRYNIDTEKDSPEEIAEAMIKLYNLLKENL